MQNLGQQVEDITYAFAVPGLETVVTLVLGIVVYLLIAKTINKLTSRGLIHMQIGSIMTTALKWLIAIMVLLFSLGFFGVSVNSFWAALSGALALVALGVVALWSVLSNVLCSILLVVIAPFRIGDEIEIQDPAAEVKVRGKVRGVNIMFTTLKTVDDDEETESEIKVPNSIFFQKYIRCYRGKRTKSIKRYLAGLNEESEKN